MGHASEHITDPHVYRLRWSTGPGYVLFAWDYPGSTLLEVCIVRSTRGHVVNPAEAEARAEAETGRDAPARLEAEDRADAHARPDAESRAGATVVFRGIAGSFRDTDVKTGRRYYYSVFARDPGDEQWVSWGRYAVLVGRPPRPDLADKLRVWLGRCFSGRGARRCC